jgi:hypothetical protein
MSEHKPGSCHKESDIHINGLVGVFTITIILILLIVCQIYNCSEINRLKGEMVTLIDTLK